MRRDLLWTSALAMSALFIGACGVPASNEGPTTTNASNLGGERLPVQIPEEDYGHAHASLTGRLNLGSNGCWTIDLGDGPRPVIFPAGFTESEDGSAMLAPDASSFVDDTAVDASGGIVGSQTLPGGPDGFWGNYLAFCEPDREEVVVADSIQPAFDPTELSEAELLEILETDPLTQSWGCGFGFTVMSESQRVGVQFYPAQMEPAPGPVVFPDDSWVGEVLIGKHLAANHCDDVFEGWEPELVIASRFPITGGTLMFELPEETDCGLTGPVTATFDDGAIDTNSGSRQLPDLVMVNESFGCFAG